MGDGGEEVVDRISSLPDSILIHILSFLPTIDAVKTVLVPGFRHLWHFLPILTFDHSRYFDIRKDDPPGEGPFYHEKFLDFVRHVLTFHQNGTLDKFVLNLELNLCFSKDVDAGIYDDDEDVEYANREKRMASEVDSWVYFAMRKDVKVLHLDFRKVAGLEPNDSYRVPSIVFTSKYLIELILSCCEIKPSDQIQLNCLKRLSLSYVVLNDDIIHQILGACSVLEELSLKGCNHLCRLVVTNPCTKSLELFHSSSDKKLELFCPYIESLEIGGSIDCVCLVDVSSVVISCITFSFNLEVLLERHQTVKAFFEELSDSKKSKLCLQCILVFSVWQLINQPDLLFGWKHVEFEFCPRTWHQPGIICLLRTSPYLETLAIYIPAGYKPKAYCSWTKLYNLVGKNFWSSQEGTFHCLENNLKTIKIYGDITKRNVMDMIEFLLNNAKVLEKLEISARKSVSKVYRGRFCDGKDELTLEQRFDLCQKKLLILPRASKHAVIVFS